MAETIEDWLTRRMTDGFERSFLEAVGTTSTHASAESEPFTKERLDRMMADVRLLGACPPPVKIIESPHMTKSVEDWSRVRSPGRAARRRKQGHRQNIAVRVVPLDYFLSIDGYYLGHRATIAKLNELLVQS